VANQTYQRPENLTALLAHISTYQQIYVFPGFSDIDAEAGYHGAQKALYIGVHQVLLYYWRNVACLDDDPKQKREKWKMEQTRNGNRDCDGIR